MHKIRKTYGTTLIDNNVDDALVAEILILQRWIRWSKHL